MRQIIKRIKKLHWVWFWSGNWPLLDALYERDEGYEREFHKTAGIHPEISVDFFKKGILTAYHCQEEYDRLGRFFLRKYKDDPLFILRSLSKYNKKIKADLDKLKKISQIDVKKVSNERLSSLFQQSRRCFEYNSAMDHYTWFLEKIFVPVLQRQIEKVIKPTEKNLVSSYLPVLVAPRKISLVYKERQSLYEIVKRILKKPSLAQKIKKTDMSLRSLEKEHKKILNLLQKHHDKYSWLSILVNSPPASLIDIWQEIRSYLRDEEAFKTEAKQINRTYSSLEKEKSRIIRKLKIGPLTRRLIKSLEEVAYVRNETNVAISKSSYYVTPLFSEISKRIGINYFALKELMPYEITDFLEKNRRTPKELIKARERLACLIVYRGRRYLLTGKAAEQINKLITANIEVKASRSHRTEKFTGTPASPGVVKGAVFLALDSKSSGKIKKGEILVAPATSVDFVPAMRMASAIITEFGGLTSHAAIVSREFGTPCIVGVRGITKQLKSGDLVEVDANKGVVRKVDT